MSEEGEKQTLYLQNGVTKFMDLLINKVLLYISQLKFDI